MDSRGTPARVFSEHVISTAALAHRARDRFDHLCRLLFLPAFPTFLPSPSPSVYLPSCPLSTRTHTCPVCGRLPAFPVLALYNRPPATRIARLNVRAFPPGRERAISLSSLSLRSDDSRGAIVRQIYFTLLLAVYGNKFPRRLDYPR